MDVVEQFKRRIFNANNYKAGIYAEGIVDGLLGMSRAVNRSYDRLHSNDRCEIKSARIVGGSDDDDQTLFDRAIDFSTYERHTFCGNVQHLKLPDFDNLFYVAFFNDTVIVFEMSLAQLREYASLIGYSCTQSRRSIPDCDGQFSLRTSNFNFHLKKFFKARLSYEEALHNFLLADRRQDRDTTRIAPTNFERKPMSPDKLRLLATTIHQNDGRVVHDLALLTKVSEKTIHDFLNSPDGAPFRALVAVEASETLPLWACDDYGKRADIRVATAILEKPKAELLVIPQPPQSGDVSFDTVNEKTHGIDTAMVNATTKKQKLGLLRSKEDAETQKALVVARLHERSDARREIISAREESLELAKADTATQKELTAMLREENARLREENARLHAEIATLRMRRAA